jgi:hypothetical protein
MYQANPIGRGNTRHKIKFNVDCNPNCYYKDNGNETWLICTSHCVVISFTGRRMSHFMIRSLAIYNEIISISYETMLYVLVVVSHYKQEPIAKASSDRIPYTSLFYQSILIGKESIGNVIWTTWRNSPRPTQPVGKIVRATSVR